MDGPTSPLCIAVRPGEARRRARGPRPGCPRRSCRPPRRRARGPRAGGSGRGAAVRLVAVPVRVLGPAPVRSSASVSRTGTANRSPSRSSFAPPRRGRGSARVAGSSERRMWAQGRLRGLRPGRRIIGVGAAGPVGLGLWTPPGSRDYHSTREGGRRDRRAAREDVCQGHDLAGRPAISRIRPERGGMGRGPGPGRPRPGPACVNCRSAQRNLRAGAGADPGPACTMRAQRDTVHPASRRASPARWNPPALDPREPTSHNASPGDITRTTPPGAGTRKGGVSAHGETQRLPPGGGDAQAKTRRAVAPTPAPARRRSHRSRRRVAPGAARPPSRRRSAGAPAAPPDRSPEEP